MQTALAELSKTALVKKASGLMNSAKRERNAAEQLGEKVMQAAGTLTATASGFAIGFCEQHFQNKDGSPLSLGPVRLGLAGAFALSGLGLFWNPGQQITAAANGCAGAYGATLGRGTAIAMAKKDAQKTAPVSAGYEEIVGGYNDAEASLLT